MGNLVGVQTLPLPLSNFLLLMPLTLSRARFADHLQIKIIHPSAGLSPVQFYVFFQYYTDLSIVTSMLV